MNDINFDKMKEDMSRRMESERLYICSICGNDILDYMNCVHWVGLTYIVDGEKQECTASIKT